MSAANEIDAAAAKIANAIDNLVRAQIKHLKFDINRPPRWQEQYAQDAAQALNNLYIATREALEEVE